MEDNTFLAPLSPIQRSTPSQRVLEFLRNERAIYGKFSPYDQAGRDIGPDQPYIYTKLTDSNFKKNFTKYASQTYPESSVSIDVDRFRKFSSSGKGDTYRRNQTFLQQTNAFSETRVYDSRSLLNSVRRAFPTRHREVNINFRNNVLNRSQTSNATSVEGTRTSNYAFSKGGAPYGLLRFETGNRANSIFKTLWGVGQGGGTSSGPPIQPDIPNTRSATNVVPWTYRPEYDTSFQYGIYHLFIQDTREFLKATVYKNPQTFYNDTPTNSESGGTSPVNNLGKAEYYHKYYPAKENASDTSTQYAPTEKILGDKVGTTNFDIDSSIGRPAYNNLKDLYSKMVAAMLPYTEGAGRGQFRSSAERYTENPVIGVNTNNNYASIPNGIGENGELTEVNKSQVIDGPFIEYLGSQQAVNELRIDNRGFSKASNALNVTGSSVTRTPDEYNLLTTIENKDELSLDGNSQQSKDLIFFYFYDLINNKYIPFRATLGSIQDNNTGDWEDIKYMGRADKLYVYKGFSREVSFNFKVYANSIYELVPNWERVNYLVGLTRPSKYTDRALQTAEEDGGFTGEDTNSTGLESGFIYPPMIEFRIGDLYVDQPAVLRNVGITVPDDAQWETLRDNKYTYVYGNEKTIIQDNVYSRQLPNIIDVSIQLSIIEREQSRTGNYNFGPQTGWVGL